MTVSFLASQHRLSYLKKEEMIKIKNTVKALIIKDGHILALKHRNEKGIYYTLPGGKQEVCETLAETLERESFEELGAKVMIEDLWAVRDFIGAKSHKKKKRDERKHVVEFIFRCAIPDGYRNQNGPSPDKGQLGVEWLNLREISEVPLYPFWLKDALTAPVNTHKTYRQEPTGHTQNGQAKLSVLTALNKTGWLK
ncbi:MAG: NUDIX domain-containing protein [Desulfobulbaceae bacterium]|nr:NUDIX domain-containing protein [Desulfobulbaceae bacterium]